jgi:HEAT repeat protein/CRP-like cAMP-binding protein
VLERIAKTYDLSIVRARSLVRSGLFFFLFVSGVTAMKSATNALYLARRDPTELPYLYLATAVAITLVTAFVGDRLTTHSAKPVLKAAVVLSAGLLLGLSFAAAAEVGPALPVLYVAGEVYATTLSVLFWSRLGEVFDVRTAKRVFGAIGAAGMAGAVTGGLLVRGLSNRFPSVVWCFFAAFSLLVILPLLGSGRGTGAIKRKKVSFREGLAYAAVDRFPRGVAALVLLFAVLTASVDYVFRTGAVRFEGSDESALAALFGSLNAVVGVGAIVVQVALTGRLLSRLGVFVFLSIIPILSVATAGWALVVPASFVPVFLLKTFEMMGSLSLYQPGLQLLYNPMPTAMRDAVRAVVDGAVKKLGGAVGGAVLIVFGSLLAQDQLLAVVIGLSLLIIAWIRTLRSGYLSALEAKLGGRAGQVLPMIDPSDRATRERLLSTLADQDPGKVLAALSVLIRERDLDLVPYFESLIAHPSEDVRVKAIGLIAEAPDPAYAPLLISVLENDARRPKAQAARALELVDRDRAVEVLAPILRSPDGHDLGLVCASIKVLLAAEASPETVALAESALERMFSEGRRGPPGQRREIARLLGHLGPGGYAPHLITYLDDPEPSVRRIAAESARQVRDPAIAPKLITMLTDRRIRRIVRNALSAYGDGVVPLLRDMLDDRRQPVELRVHIPMVLREIGTDAAAEAMLYSNVHDDAFLRYVIIRSLARMRRESRTIRFERQRTEEAAMRRLRAFVHYRPIAADIAAGGPAYNLLRRAVEDRVRQNLEAGLSMLGLVYDQQVMMNAAHGLLQGKHADAVELVDVALQGADLRAEIVGLIEQSLPSSSPERATMRAFALVEGRDMQVAMIAWETLKRLGNDPPDVREPTLGEPLMSKQIVDRVFILEGVQLFHGLSVDDLAAVAGITNEGHAAGGEIIYRQGDPGDSMYIIVSGEVRLLKDGLPLMDLYAGDSFGQVSILDRGTRPVDARAGDEGVDYLYLEREPFMDLIADRPEVINGLFVVLARRLRELVDLTGHAAGPRAEEKSTPSVPAEKAPS